MRLVQANVQRPWFSKSFGFFADKFGRHRCPLAIFVACFPGSAIDIHPLTYAIAQGSAKQCSDVRLFHMSMLTLKLLKAGIKVAVQVQFANGASIIARFPQIISPDCMRTVPRRGIAE